ncbi:hypothetical protein F0U60_45975 [Archangium minus]|uniref:Uncharacterized protein n=1 Tax=Archangium minus TaxID=83450 RepID=A0ABY9X5K2_9BACT|nr:hypothetical protein F0U60_45975 [Archangium minus]
MTELKPRREAGPLRTMKQLTAEQRSAGAQAAALLHAMAKASPPPRRVPPAARRFLPVIDEERWNQVILLDGNRGSGKSALLLTLLEGYSETLQKGRPPPEFADWFDPSDRIVPVGLVDLQPQPSTTNLLFLLMGNLERVVHTLWPQREHGKPGAMPWHVPAPEEPCSLRLWRNFVRVAASSEGGNVQDRKKELDPEAFAREQMNEDIRRLDLQTVFRDFMDALVKDYLELTHQCSGPLPLFLLAIDDADMNPRLSAHLLEVLRKLYHPRLAFLFTGDSSLFIKMLKLDLLRDARRGMGPLAEPDESDLETLALEIYAKVIPQGHRCSLPALREEERLSAIPELEELLTHTPVQTRKGLSPARLSLRDYLAYGSQMGGALPERLRSLWDLYGELAYAVEELKQREFEEDRAAVVIETLWKSVLSSGLVEPRMEDALQGAIHRRQMRLWVEAELAATPVLRKWGSYSAGNGWQLVIESPERFRLTLRGKELDSRTTAALMLAVNFAADDVRGAFSARSPAVMDPRVHVFAHGVGLLDQVGQIVAPWPTPDWESFEDLFELKELWEFRLRFVAERPTRSDYLARCFLSSVLKVGKHPRFGHRASARPELEPDVAPETEAEEQDDVLLEWEALAENLVAFAREIDESGRASALSDWALSRAGLLAAPESGLPADVANTFLRILRKAFGHDWERARAKLREMRRVRLRLTQEQEDGASTKNAWLERIDQQFPEHEFGGMVENRGVQLALGKVLDNFHAALDRIRIPWLRSIFINASSPSLRNYLLTPYRAKLLEEVPSDVLLQATRRLIPFRNISGEGAPALVELWRFAVSWSNAGERMQKAVREEKGSLVIDPLLLRALTRGERIPVREWFLKSSKEPVPLWAAEDLRTTLSGLRVWTSPLKVHNLNPLLELLLRIAYDYSQDQQGRNTLMPIPKSKHWPGTRFRYDRHGYYPWTIPAWPTLMEMELFEPAWNDMVTNVRRTNPSGARGEGGKYVDAIAYWLLHSTQMLSMREPPQDELQIEPRQYDWEQVTKPFFNRRDPPHIYRDSLLESFLAQLPLMAAPECGLSRVAVDVLLAPIRDEIARESRARDRWNNLREERLELAGVPKAEVKGLLRKLDDKRKDHPWVLLMKKPRPPRPGKRKVVSNK